MLPDLCALYEIEHNQQGCLYDGTCFVWDAETLFVHSIWKISRPVTELDLVSYLPKDYKMRN